MTATFKLFKLPTGTAGKALTFRPATDETERIDAEQDAIRFYVDNDIFIGHLDIFGGDGRKLNIWRYTEHRKWPLLGVLTRETLGALPPGAIDQPAAEAAAAKVVQQYESNRQARWWHWNFTAGWLPEKPFAETMTA